ncbi:MAG: chromosome segregation protein SMC [Lachnospiraceae bacterium]
MYLKSIQVQGFKSFAHKIVFDFHTGITGIVGPNGSGKSNVADAVRWVLGEQRIKQLRGGSMQDVIFSGTENRKPLSYASVAITLDNSDHQLPIEYEEVTVARKIYRSGESEYLINGSNCRLKDVNELFYDTGIGKEGYSIIGQGQIDKILSGKPEERRELFDEAAGIVKFKRRKSMSVKKLEDEQQNLLRVTDILSELEKQIGPLEKQSEIAKEYLKNKDQLKTYDINMFLLEIDRLKDQVKQIDTTLAITNDEIVTASKQYENMKLEYETVEDQLDGADASIEQAKRQLNETNLLKQQLESQIALLKEQINSLKMNDEHFEQRSLAIFKELEERKQQQESLLDEKTTIQSQLDEKTKLEVTASENLVVVQTKIATLSDAIEHEKNEIMELLTVRSSTKSNIQRYDTILEQIKERQVTLKEKQLRKKSDNVEHGELLERYEQELQQIAEKIAGYLQESEQYELRIEQLQGQISKQTEQLRIGQTAFHREQSRLESLKNITERYDGYGNSIRKVMENREHETGLLGVVADIVKVDKDYEIAIETALGGNIQNIVTDNEDTAKRMIGYLKQNKYGRATFLPLTAIRANGGIRQPEVLKEEGVLGIASSLVMVDHKYTGLAEHLLGRTIVVKNINCGVLLAKKYKQSLRIVTVEGELINPGGSMTGGAFKNSSNLLSRRREIEEFEKSVIQLKKEMEEMEQVSARAREERASCYEKVEEIKQKLQRVYVMQNTAQMNKEQVLEKQEVTKEMIARIQREEEELEQQIIDIGENQESILVELETSENLEKELSGKIEIQQKEMEQSKLEESMQLKDSETIHLSYAGLEQKNLFILENTTRIQEEMEKFQDELELLNQNKGEYSQDMLDKEQQIQELKQTIQNSKELFEEIEIEIQKYVKERENLQKQHKTFLAKREDLSKHMSELDKEAFRLNSKREDYEEATEKQINYMWEEYELTYNHALELRDSNLTDLVYMKKQIQRLKNEIRSLGDVNVNAIEEFKNLSKRYEFLKDQHDDLVEAEETLMQIIEELDIAMRKQFKEQFDAIAKEFDHVFKELFGGGKGTLELMEEEDLLEAGIRIIAQPPGKKLQNMMQLSGGEKALTAIALLFAIQNLKPSPFCLLDEIEAALDDSNVVRFAQYLHKLTKNTQFIVITHRRGTMTAADRLYGITMQEKGVSTLVSVNLLEDKLDK